MLLDATGGELDIAAADLRANSRSPWPTSIEAILASATSPSRRPRHRAGRPDRSLIYHAFASPTVVADRRGTPLGFPTMAEIEAVENYVYGGEPPTIEELRRALPGGDKARPRGVRAALSQHPDVGAWAPCRALLPPSGIARLGRSGPSTRAGAPSSAWMRRGRSTSASCRGALRRILRRSCWADPEIRTSGSAAGRRQTHFLGADPQTLQRPRVHRRPYFGSNSAAACATTSWRSSTASSSHALHNNWTGEVLDDFPFMIKRRLSARCPSPLWRGRPGAGPSPLLTPRNTKGGC